MEELVNCPFCGGEAKLEFIQTLEEYYCRCLQCRVEQPLYPSAEEAIRAWNTRI